ncbi:MAG TPA: DUF5010 domain-containing protein [Polyangia bacterium]|nr:DUF5010 domain-containing protein [Polyangia bacterium]
MPVDDATLFRLKPEWEGPSTRTDAVDVNLGHTPEAFIKAAYGQITGRAAPTEVVQQWAGRLRQQRHVRRVDVVRALAAEHKRRVTLSYSDPWQSQPELAGAPERAIKRDIGAVFMFFFNCPGGVNCEMNWANTHAAGMDGPHPLYGARPGQSGLYSAQHPGFWRRELLEAQYAGLQFLLLNVYGPDIEEGRLEPLRGVLAGMDDPIKVALFDDTWTWGKPYFSDFWRRTPDLGDVEHAARVIYESKWKPFYERIDRRHWYRFAGRPFIYFYDGGTLQPRQCAAPVIARCKQMFQRDFGEEPFVDVDVAFFADPQMPRVADAEFTWMTLDLPHKKSRSRLGGYAIDHAMVKWDSVGRDRPGELATEGDRILKDGALLERVLRDSSDADLLVLATWNDLGEGTGINRNYDYYSQGCWLPPDHFMQLIRQSQRQS